MAGRVKACKRCPERFELEPGMRDSREFCPSAEDLMKLGVPKGEAERRGKDCKGEYRREKDREERARTERDLMAAEAWEAKQDLQRAEEHDRHLPLPQPAVEPELDGDETPQGKQRRREGLHLAASLPDDQGQLIVGTAKDGTRRRHLPHELETDGDGQRLGCEKKKARRESYKDLQDAARLEVAGLPPAPNKSYSRQRYSERKAPERKIRAPRDNTVRYSWLVCEDCGHRHDRRHRCGADREVKALCEAIMRAHTIAERRHEPEAIERRGRLLGQLRVELNGSYAATVESCLPFKVDKASEYIEEVLA